MAAGALVSGECGDNPRFIFACVFSAPLINGTGIIYCLIELFIDIAFVFAWGVVVFFVHFCVEIDDLIERCCKWGGVRECEVVVGVFVEKSYDVNSFPVLWDVAVVHGVEDFVGGVVAVCGESVEDCVEGVSVVVGF